MEDRVGKKREEEKEREGGKELQRVKERER